MSNGMKRQAASRPEMVRKATTYKICCGHTVQGRKTGIADPYRTVAGKPRGR